ncbi:MAG TPA: hypothetical protein DEE98_04045 [Elusimicrobia bacterium]|nr:MAG: hypothetical protein A2278_07055 [Elusimicrobia bacterium RIFOXYA12_FULL_49_49]OGS09224.1 MAG: hypothetical protein A2204_04390 [Elusimicrobia bacterium RIFOXYA1_FULL_47_7]OGS16205.1 MAG: hypothetical protein A2251_01130 [Elusimicrobia bacterium RIFOXYA2_FULL_47_53]OGS26596.1 MAG: hypothetical protein A2339_04230 [Elusimicrobia bacterium RIFOXYB12_FULL_50_12]OGS31359.1 MAG: hypothetical protein A2323_09420 [Elusimicrobia bacterium RIFOXYB2_FULL_46_23]HBU69538.1 hypothetical protein [El
MAELKRYFLKFMDFFSDSDNPEEPFYDPSHFGAMIVLTIAGISVLFWLLWTLLVFGGGIQAKVVPFLSVVFTSRTFSDFGYIGYPYEMGVFEGWIANLVALLFFAAFSALAWYAYNKTLPPRKDN